MWLTFISGSRICLNSRTLPELLVAKLIVSFGILLYLFPHFYMIIQKSPLFINRVSKFIVLLYYQGNVFYFFVLEPLYNDILEFRTYIFSPIPIFDKQIAYVAYFA